MVGGELAIGVARPVDSKSFADALDALGPFEPAPVLAVAVSGGADSMALALLAQRWARARRGRVVALTVDHRLRPESTAEARTVARWMGARGIAHVRLAWHRPNDDGIAGNIQARARAARYRVMADWCSAHGVLHLLLAHHRDDQAETLLLRLGRGSGIDGLAAMAPIVETHGVRLLRPLLSFPHSRLAATVRREKQPWIDDPSNRNARYARVRLRALAPALAEEGLTAERLAATAGRLRRAREVLEQTTADFLAVAATPFAEGYVTLDRAALRAAPQEIAARALARIVAAVGGLAYPPRRERTDGLLAKLLAPARAARAGTGDTVLATLGGVLVVDEGAERLLFVREPAAIDAPIAIAGPGAYLWDNRFLIEVGRSVAGFRGTVRTVTGMRIGALGVSGARLFVDRGTDDWLLSIPRRVRVTLPALLDRANRPVALANFGFSASYGRGGGRADSLRSSRWRLDAHFAPPLPLVGSRSAGFILV